MILLKAHTYLLTVIKDPTYFDSDHESSSGMLDPFIHCKNFLNFNQTHEVRSIISMIQYCVLMLKQAQVTSAICFICLVCIFDVFHISKATFAT
jgi:hypothetical protein